MFKVKKKKKKKKKKGGKTRLFNLAVQKIIYCTNVCGPSLLLFFLMEPSLFCELKKQVGDLPTHGNPVSTSPAQKSKCLFPHEATSSSLLLPHILFSSPQFRAIQTLFFLVTNSRNLIPNASLISNSSTNSIKLQLQSQSNPFRLAEKSITGPILIGLDLIWVQLDRIRFELRPESLNFPFLYLEVVVVL